MFFQDIETERLFLKNISFEDRDFILRQFSDDDVNRYLYDAEPLSNLKEADEIIDFYLQPEPRGQHRWIIIDKKTNEKIGTCGFHCWNPEEKSAEIGYDLQKIYWGNGIMSEALNAMLSAYIPKMSLDRIDAHIFVDNLRSINLVHKYGFRFEGKEITYTFRGKDYLHHIYTYYRNSME